MEVKHFHESKIKCSAIVVDWVELNKLNHKSDDGKTPRLLKYLGNYMDDDSTSVWAVFGRMPKRYCVLIDK